MRRGSAKVPFAEEGALRKLLWRGMCHPVTRRSDVRENVPVSSQTARISA